MLLQFNVKNFKSFREEASFDMTATGISDYKSHVVPVGREKVLPLSAVLGANASGKSNLIDAFRQMHTYVLLSANAKEKERAGTALLRPFLFSEASSKEPVVFEVYFITTEEDGAKTYQYGFSIKNDCVIEEWLYAKAKTARTYRQIFYRNEEEHTLEMPGIRNGRLRENIEASLQPHTLVVSLGANLRVEICQTVRQWFARNDFTDFGDPGENYLLSSMLPAGFLEPRVQERVVRFLSSFDPSIVGFRVEQLPEGADGHIRFAVFAKHRRKEDSGITELPLYEESAGTLKMLALYQHLENVFRRGSVLFVDELNSKLHPLLVRLVLLSFADPARNPRHAQLIFTTHDPWILEHGNLRRDEIWFTEKDVYGQSLLYTLSEFDSGNKKIRKDENYAKNYMLGKYGAIPSLDFFPFGQEEGGHEKA